MLWTLVWRGEGGVGCSVSHTSLPVTGCGVFLLVCIVNIVRSVLCCFLKLLKTQNWFLFWSLLFGASLHELIWLERKSSCTLQLQEIRQMKTFLLSIPVVPAVEFLSLIYQELWKKDPEDGVGGIQSSKLVLLTCRDSFNSGRGKVSCDRDGVQNKPNSKTPTNPANKVNHKLLHTTVWARCWAG